MEKIQALEDAIIKKNMVGIYSVFYTILHGDPGFYTGKFDETLKYVKSKRIPGFIQEFDNEEFEPEEDWNEDYWALIASSLLDNFCEERIEFLKKIGKKLYPPKTIRNNRNNNSSGNAVHGMYSNGSSETNPRNYGKTITENQRYKNDVDIFDIVKSGIKRLFNNSR